MDKNPAKQFPHFADDRNDVKACGLTQESSRVSRLLYLAQAVREDPFQQLGTLLDKLGIGRSQF